MRGSQPWQVNRARVLRSAPSPAEMKLWSKLRNRQLGGKKFIRQFPIGPFFADFTCRDVMLVIEIDGETHSTVAERGHDAARDDFMRRQGYRVMRFSNRDVYDSLEGVLDSIETALMCG